MLSVKGVSNLNTQMGQVQASLQMRNQNAYEQTQNAFSGIKDKFDFSRPEIQNQFNTYNAQGQWNKSEFNNSLIANTFDRFNQPQSYGFSRNAQADSYNFNKEVLGAFANYLR